MEQNELARNSIGEGILDSGGNYYIQLANHRIEDIVPNEDRTPTPPESLVLEIVNAEGKVAGTLAAGVKPIDNSDLPARALFNALSIEPPRHVSTLSLLAVEPGFEKDNIPQKLIAGWLQMAKVCGIDCTQAEIPTHENSTLVTLFSEGMVAPETTMVDGKPALLLVKPLTDTFKGLKGLESRDAFLGKTGSLERVMQDGTIGVKWNGEAKTMRTVQLPGYAAYKANQALAKKMQNAPQL